MKYLREYRDPGLIRDLAAGVHERARQTWRLMEVCGGQTNTILRAGLDQCLAPTVTFLHGPGCPVCVTPAETIDFAQQLAIRPGTILCTFGDMVRVPGSVRSLAEVAGAGGRVKTLYSPLDAVTIAREMPTDEVVLFAIGFETTAPLTALAILQAADQQLRNFSVLSAHVLIPPAIAAVLRIPSIKVDALLAPGHVCTVSGLAGCRQLCDQFRMPIVVTGFEPVDILQGVLEAVTMLERGEVGLKVQYRRAVTSDGNIEAGQMVESVFRKVDRRWRGLGVIPKSGLGLNESYRSFDAEYRFLDSRPEIAAEPPTPCADVLTGRMPPPACPLFGGECRPEHPKGAPMVSFEGACAAHHQVRQIDHRIAGAARR